MVLGRFILVVACCALWATAAVNPQHKPRRPHKSDEPKKTPQPSCDPNECGVFGADPECACASVQNPLEEEAEYMPQLVVLSFDDAVKVDNIDFYLDLLRDYKNPNKCPISMTYFITHKYNDYASMNELHRLGNEIAAHSVSHVEDVENYWRKANYSTWFSEINDSKQMIMKYGLIPEEDIKGWRTPFLEVGGNEMYQALVDAGLQYDSSISTFKYTNWYTNAGETAPYGALYPFTMDNNLTMDCAVGTCPTDTYPGFWMTPMIDLNDPRPMNNSQQQSPNLRAPCNMLDSCIPTTDNTTDTNDWDCPQSRCKENIVNWLKDSFKSHYENNKAPFGIYAHYSWFLIDDFIKSKHKEAYLEFLDYLQTLNDVWIVNLATVIEWMKDPMFADDMVSWDPVTCGPLPKTNCPDPITCTYESNLPFSADRVTMSICTRPCPPNYPWLNDINGLRL